ncbi:MAG: hypothetical protein ACT4P4_05785 [Betaproteobacteria bacterium]
MTETARRAGPGWVLLVLAVAFGAHAALSFFRLKNEIAESEARLARSAVTRAEMARKASPMEPGAVREAVTSLSLPWTDLFRAIEGATSDEVALLAVEPDPTTGTVLISADTLSYLAALAYVRSLAASGALSQVHLVRHEWKAGAMQFSVSADWVQRRMQAAE